MKRQTLRFALLFLLGVLWYSQTALLHSRSSSLEVSASSAVPNEQSKPAMKNDAGILVDGELLKAFQVAHTAFLRSSNIPAAKKHLENYDVQLSKEADGLIVIFVPRRKPGEPMRLGGSTELGVAVRFVISADNYRVIDMKFFK